MSTPLALGVLISGGGTNLQAILDRVADGFLPCRVALVVSNDDMATGLGRARQAGVPAKVVCHRDFATREDFDRALSEELEAASVELVALAGFMRILSPWFVRRWSGKIVNIHPTLLPAFPGTHVHRQVLTYGARFSGCTVHFVDEGTDTGPIIAQAVVPVLQDDSEDSLARRILAQEHRIYPQALRWIAEGRVKIQGRLVTIEGGMRVQDYAVHNPPFDLSVGS